VVNILNKTPENNHVVVNETPIENWGFNGKQFIGFKK